MSAKKKEKGKTDVTDYVEYDNRNFEERYRACFIDLAFKAGAGFLLGSMVGGFFLRGYKKWPLILGGGLGAGMAYSNCENSLNGYLLGLKPEVCRVKKTP